MRKIANIFLIALLVISCTSCTIIVPAIMWTTQEKVSHQDIMSSYKTKQDVIKHFGIATEKVTEEGVDIWIYKKGNANNDDTFSNSIINSNIEFQFEDGKNVSSWRTQEGENYGNVNDRVKKTYIGYVIGGVIDAIILVILLAGSS